MKGGYSHDVFNCKNVVLAHGFGVFALDSHLVHRSILACVLRFLTSQFDTILKDHDLH